MRHASAEMGAMMLTGPRFEENHVLDDGTPVTVRHVRPEDAAELKRGFDSLSPSSRYRRFLGSMTTLSDSTLHYLTCVDGRDHVAIVAVTRPADGGAERGLGIARFVRAAEDPTVAEAAITVIDDVQHKGLGRILALTLARAALERGVKRFRGEILVDNEPVRQLLDEVGATIRSVGDGALLFDVDLGPPDNHDAHGRLEMVARRFLRAASSYLAGLIRGLVPLPPKAA
jgi:GNAT superfamily N-acetyltransferase